MASYSKKSINSLQNKQGILIHNQKKILNELANFYENLYFDNEQSDENNCYDFVTKLNLPTITEEECKECDNQSPGLHGFQLNFIKHFGNILMISF